MTPGVQEQILAEIKGLNALAAKLLARPIIGQEVHVVSGLSEISERLGLIMAGEFRATDHPEIAPGDGFTGVRLTEAGLKAYNNDLQTVGVENDGDFFLGGDVSAPSTTGFMVFSSAQTYNGESVGAGDIMMGDNSTDAPNLFWDASEGKLKFRLGTLDILHIYSKGLQYVGDPGTSGVAFFCCGEDFAWLTTVTKLNFSDDTLIAFYNSFIYPLEGPGAVSATAAGYILGGFLEGINETIVTAQKLTFATGAIALVGGADLSIDRGYTGQGHSSTKGYVLGGYNEGIADPVTTIDALTFATETSAALVAVLPAAREKLGSLQSSLAIYVSGGQDTSANDNLNTYKIDFATETASTPASAALADARRGMTGVSGSSVGILCGGSYWNGSAHIFYESTKRLTFATEVMADIGAVLSSKRRQSSGVSNLTTGYIYSGRLEGGRSTILDKVNIAAETIAIIPIAAAYSQSAAGGLVYL